MHFIITIRDDFNQIINSNDILKNITIIVLLFCYVYLYTRNGIIVILNS